MAVWEVWIDLLLVAGADAGAASAFAHFLDGKGQLLEFGCLLHKPVVGLDSLGQRRLNRQCLCTSERLLLLVLLLLLLLHAVRVMHKKVVGVLIAELLLELLLVVVVVLQLMKASASRKIQSPREEEEEGKEEADSL